MATTSTAVDDSAPAPTRRAAVAVTENANGWPRAG